MPGTKVPTNRHQRVRRNTQATRPPLAPRVQPLPPLYPIPGWEGKYAIDDAGNVWSLPRSGPTYCRAEAKRMRVTRGGRRNNYLRVHLTDRAGGRDFYAYVHHLAALTFLGPRPAGMEVLHGPGGSLDNSRGNLRYGTREENAMDSEVDRWNKANPDAEAAPF